MLVFHCAEELSTRRRPKVVGGKEVRMLHILFHFCPAEVLMLCVSVLYVQIGVRLRRTYVLQHILFFKSNVLLQTPDPRAGVHLFTGVTRSARSRTSRSQRELQHKNQTLDEIPELSTHQLASLTYWRQAPPTIRSCWLQPKLHRGNICYIFLNIFLLFLSHWHTSCSVISIQ